MLQQVGRVTEGRVGQQAAAGAAVLVAQRVLQMVADVLLLARLAAQVVHPAAFEQVPQRGFPVVTVLIRRVGRIDRKIFVEIHLHGQQKVPGVRAQRIGTVAGTGHAGGAQQNQNVLLQRLHDAQLGHGLVKLKQIGVKGIFGDMQHGRFLFFIEMIP